MRGWGLLAAMLLAAAPAVGQQKIDPKQKSDPPQSAQPAAQPQVQVSVEQALYLIRSTLLTLNDANRSGNYTVLRDLAAPDFQAKNTAADLALIFSDLRQRKFDLFAVALAAPQLTAAPALDANKMLRLTGFFPTRPAQINFDLIYRNVGGQWQLFGIAVATPPAPQAQSSHPAQSPPVAAAEKGKAPARKAN